MSRFAIAYAIALFAILCGAVARLPAAQDDVKSRKTVREPVYTAAQAERGKQVYEANCITCHLADLDGSANPTAGARGAPLAGTRFVQDFGESKLSALFNKMKRDMPSGRPGTLTDQQYLDAATYVLQKNNFPAGPDELTVEAAENTWIPGAGGAEGLQNYTFVSSVGCLYQDPSRSWLLTHAEGLTKTEPAAAGSLDAAASGPASGPAPGSARGTPGSPNESGDFTFRLLDAIHHKPEPHNGHKVRVTGHMVRLGAEIRVNVASLEMISATCGN
jgi:mono/diheme cytochrome c family protein